MTDIFIASIDVGSGNWNAAFYCW